jgi:hypothetical protein
MERKFDRDQACVHCGEIVDVRNGYMVTHNAANGTQCPGSHTIGVTVEPWMRDRDF